MQSIEELKSEIKLMLIDVADLQDHNPEDISDDMELFGKGLSLDSIDVLEIAVNLDRNYGLKIKNDEEGRKTLQSVQSIAQAIMATRNS